MMAEQVESVSATVALEEAAEMSEDRKTDIGKSPTNIVVQEPQPKLLFKVHENCPAHLGFVYGFQQLAESAAGSVGGAVILSSVLCARNDDPLQFAELVNAVLFLTGVSSFLEIVFGFRLPVMEGPAGAFLAPILSMPYLAEYKCVPPCSEVNQTALVFNMTTAEPCEDNAYENRLREVGGSMMCAGLAQIALGACGGAGFLLDYISSLTVSVTILMLGISLYPVLTERLSLYWPASLLTCGSYIMFSLILAGVKVPFPTWNRRRGFHVKRYPIFRIYPSLFSIGVGWLFCYILTIAGALPDDPDRNSYQARTDYRSGVVERADWFFLPYPGRIGMPTIGVGLFVGFLGSISVSTFESIGDYHNLARACEVPPPPKHALNRGIAVEGICTIFSGSIGAVLGTTTYSDVAGFISITGVASRFAWIMVSVFFMIAGLLGKMTAAIAICPDPVIAGFNVINYGLIVVLGMSHLQKIEITSSRNMVVLATGIFLGLCVPEYARGNIDDLDIGVRELNQVIQILLTSNMFVGGVITFILDNIVPGTREERGILTFRSADSPAFTNPDYIDELDRAYGWPVVAKWMRRHEWFFRWVPFLPP